MTMVWVLNLNEKVTLDHLGLIPGMLDENDPAPAREQLDAAYQHGGGWRPFPGFKLRSDNSIKYPGDPPYPPLAVSALRDELIIIYEHGWVAIIQPDRSFEVCRMD